MAVTDTPPALDSVLLSRRDQRFLLHEWLGVEELCTRERYAEQSRALYDDVLDLAAQLATDRFAPHAHDADEQEPALDDAGRVVLRPEIEAANRAHAEAGFVGIGMGEDVGGLGLPHVIANAAFAWFAAANVGSSAYGMLTVGAANLLIDCATPEQIERWVTPMVEGRFFGTMCISETQAGSSVGDSATRAEPQEDGGYRLFGSKMWISGGDHEMGENIVHLVLARIAGAPAGTKGLSLFVVPRYLLGEDGSRRERNDVTLAGLNHKMGYRATVNTVLGFGEGTFTPGGRAGAVGELVGAPGAGMATMFHMMNEARLGVGMGAVALGTTGYLRSLQYARERPQGRALGAGLETPQVPIVQHADVRRMLLTQKAYVEGGMALLLFCSKLVDDAATAPDEEERRRAGLLVEMLTPIAKSWPSQWCLEANSLAIQVLGGYGYAREYGVERLYRDNRLNPIHEGTHAIQAMDLLGRKTRLQGGAGFAALLEAMQATAARALDAGGLAAELAPALQAAVGRIGEATGAVAAAASPVEAMANATLYLEAAGHVVVAWMWLELVLAAGDHEDPFYAGKRQAARWFFASELPRTGPQLDLLVAGDRTTLDMADAWF